MFNAVHDHFASTIHRDAEMLYVVGLICSARFRGDVPARGPGAFPREADVGGLSLVVPVEQ